MREKGLSRAPVFLVIPTKDLSPLLTFSDQYTTFTRLLFVDWANIYQTAAKIQLSSHRNQCRTVLPSSVRRHYCTIKIRQTRLRGIYMPYILTAPSLYRTLVYFDLVCQADLLLQTCKSSANLRNSADFDIFWVILEICPDPRRK